MFHESRWAGIRRTEQPASVPRNLKVILNTELETMPVRSAIRPQTMPAAVVQGHGFCRLTREQIGRYRRQPESASPPFPALQPSTLRHSDDQTIAALAAVHSAVRGMGDRDRDELQRWGILVASRFLGRSSLVVALERFITEGVWGVSPHLIPHYALHSPAGTLSLALGIRGPALGIGGGHQAEFEGLMTALTWLAAGVVSGLWLVQTAWSPEFLPDQKGEPLAECECLALAMALVPSALSLTRTRPELRLVASRDLRARRDLAMDQLASLLEQETTTPAACADPWSSMGRSHRVHSPSQGPQPQSPPHARTGSTARTIACDASGRIRIELIVPHRHHIREDD